MKRFEYKTIKILRGFWNTTLEPDNIDQKLNELGAQGWELVTVQHNGMSGSTTEFFYTFKRER